MLHDPVQLNLMFQALADPLGMAEQWMSERRQSSERRLDRLGDYLLEHAEKPVGTP